jgi:hypothetical protein
MASRSRSSFMKMVQKLRWGQAYVHTSVFYAYLESAFADPECRNMVFFILCIILTVITSS